MTILSLPLRTPTSPGTESVHHHACPLCGLWGSTLIKIPVLARQVFYPMSRLSSPFTCLFVELLICVCMHVASVCECSHVCGAHVRAACVWGSSRLTLGTFFNHSPSYRSPSLLLNLEFIFLASGLGSFSTGLWGAADSDN